MDIFILYASIGLFHLSIIELLSNPNQGSYHYFTHYSAMHFELCALPRRLLPLPCTSSSSNLKKAKHKKATLPKSLKHPKSHVNKPIP